VTILWAIFSTAYAAYLLIHYLLGNRAAAFVGGFIYSFAPHHIAHAGGHPDLVHLAPIPLAVLLLIYTLRNGRSRWAIFGTAVLIAASAFTSLYIMVFSLLTLGPLFIILALEEQRWRTRAFWQKILWIGGITAVLFTIRLWPIITNLQTLDKMIEVKYAASTGQTDLRALVTPSQFNPLFAPLVKPISGRFKFNDRWPAYLGIIPLLLTLVAFTRRKKWAEVALWFGTGLMFLLFALGPTLRFNGELYKTILLPAHYLAWFPPIRAVGRPDFFVLGLLLIVLFANTLGVLPTFGWGESWRQAVMPVITLSTGGLAIIARLTRASMLETVREDYIRTARAKGLHDRMVVSRHALKNSLIPVATILGPLAAAWLTGSFLVEIIFSIGGIGKFFVTSISDRDYTLIMGTVLIYTTAVVLFNLVVDVFYGFLDPRIRYD